MSELEVLKRAFLPEAMLPPDVAVALNVSEDVARHMLLSGQLGRVFKVGETVGILRSTFIQALKRRGAGR